MLKKTLGTKAISAAIAVAALAGFAGSVQAKVSPISWNPAFGAPFLNLEWGGVGVSFIPNACLALTGWISNSDPCSANVMNPTGTMSLSGMTLTFSDVSNPTFVLDAIALTAPTVYSMYVQGGQLKGIETSWFNPVTSNIPQALLAGNPVFWNLKFLKEVSPSDTPSVFLGYTKSIIDPACLLDGKGECGGIGGAGQEKAILNVVPEPETYALMLGGLLAVGAMVRRRKQ